MKKIVVLLFVFLFYGYLSAQPTVLGTQLVNGSYATYDLTTRGGAKGIQLQATSSGASGRNWEFATGTAASTDYSTNWRPYTSSQTLSGYNVQIDPSSAPASARYNTRFGGASGLLPAITVSSYYTVIVGTNASSNNFMSILETTYLPRTISTVTDNYSGAGTAVTVTITLNGALNTGEYLYIRYTTDNYTSSTVDPVTTGSNPYTVIIPGASVTETTNNSYYVFTSNSSTTPTSSNADYLTLNYGNNSGSNYPLPVELTSFSASVNNKTVNLVWRTATEVNNYGFEIQRSAANGSFAKVGFVNGNGTSNSPKEYNFTDKTVSTGKYLYRLKQIDNDGKYEYSKEVEADLGKPTTFALNQNYPNPFNPTTVISYQLPANSFVTLKVYNAIGTEVATLVNEYKETGSYNYELGIKSAAADYELSSGIYFYTLRAGDFVQTKKMILLK